MKRTISLFLVMVIMFSVFSFMPNVEETAVATTGTPAPTPIPTTDFSFDPATGTILRYNRAGGNVEIPSQIGGITVTKIANDAFGGCTGLINVTIPSTVISIGTYSFRRCTGLVSITVDESNPNYSSIDGVLFNKAGTTLVQYPCGKSGQYIIPSNVTSIGVAFYGCVGLTDITIPSSLSRIEDFAFYQCTNLKSISIPNSVSSIGSHAFYWCIRLVDITIPNSVTSIGTYSFYGCVGLGSITIPSSLASIGDYAFSACSGLTEINIQNGVKSIGFCSFEGCTGLINIDLPNSITNISALAFRNCTGLINIALPDSVTSIGYSAFSECKSLKNFTVSNSVTSMGDYVFSGCTNLISINVDSANPNYSSIGGVLFNKTGTTLIQYPIRIGGSYNIPSSVTSINKYAFADCGALNGITIPNGVTSIGAYAFYNCTGLTNIIIPMGVTNIGEYAFYNCKGLTNIIIPIGVTSVGNYAFYGCTGLTNVELPNSITSIGRSAFDGCVSLGNITIPSNVASIGNSAFFSCTGLVSIAIPSSVTSIGLEAFSYCAGLTDIIIPSSVTSIANYAFYGCNKLTIYTSSGSYAASYANSHSIPVGYGTPLPAPIPTTTPPPTPTPTPLPGTEIPAGIWTVETLNSTNITSSGAVIGATARCIQYGYYNDQGITLFYWESNNPDKKIPVIYSHIGDSSITDYYSCNILLSGLKENTLYKYQARLSNNTFGEVKSFSTLIAQTPTPMPTLAPTPAPTPIPVDKSGLAAKLAEARNQYDNMSANIGPGMYTIQMVTGFAEKIQIAQAVYDKADATQTEIYIATANLCLECSHFGPPGADWWLYSSSSLTPNPFGKAGASLVRFDANRIGLDPSKDNLLVLINGDEARFTSHNGVKKFVALVDSSFSALTFAEGTPKELKYGDINLNNSIEATDINLLKGTVAGNRAATENFEFLASDVTGDGLVNASDYNTFKGFIVGNIVDFPVDSN